MPVIVRTNASPLRRVVSNAPLPSCRSYMTRWQPIREFHDLPNGSAVDQLCRCGRDRTRRSGRVGICHGTQKGAVALTDRAPAARVCG